MKYTIATNAPRADTVQRSFTRCDFAADYAYAAIRASFEARALLDRQCAYDAIAKLPDDLRTVTGALVVDCGQGYSVTISREG